MFVVGSLGYLAFEIGRLIVARDQLRSATDAGSLAAAATMASSNASDLAAKQTEGINAARQVFVANDIFGIRLNNIAAPGGGPLGADQVRLRFRFLDPVDNSPVPLGDERGKVFEVTATYGYVPVFFQFVNLQNQPAPITAISSGGIGNLDVVMCFDVSGSIDDQTKTTAVRRQVSGDRVVYQVSNQGTLSTMTRSPLGTGLNALPPQNLSALSRFRADIRATSNDIGTKPGGATGGGTDFTDLVVNLDEGTTFSSFNSGDFSFPNLGALVEAARGNLENASVFSSSGAQEALGNAVAPRAGYQAAYLKEARKHIHPLKEAQDAAVEFFNLMGENTKGHFGLVAFSSDVGTSPDNSFTATAVDPGYRLGGNTTCPLPGVDPIRVDPTGEQNKANLDRIKALIPTLKAEGGTNIGGSLSRAIDILESQGRKSAARVIIMFTDGFPTAGPDARAQARRAASKGIPVYTIGLAQSPEVVPEQTAFLTDRRGSDGIAALAGNGGKFFLVTDTSQLTRVFRTLARHLTQIVQ